MQSFLDELQNVDLRNPVSEQGLSLLVKNMLAGRFPTPEIVTLPDAFMRKGGTAIVQTNQDGRERGFTLLVNSDNQLMIPNENRWAIGDSNSVTIKPFNEPDIRDIGSYHTHPYRSEHGARASLAFSDTDIITFLKCTDDHLSIVGAPDGTFLMMVRTLKTPICTLDPIASILGQATLKDPTAEIKSIFKDAEIKYAGLRGFNWVNLAMTEVKERFGLEFYQTEARASQHERVSVVMVKVDLTEEGFASKCKN